MKVKLTIELDVLTADEEEIRNPADRIAVIAQLESIPNEAANRGRFTGDLPFIIDNLSYKVEISGPSDL